MANKKDDVQQFLIFQFYPRFLASSKLQFILVRDRVRVRNSFLMKGN
ncbi:hypothetical protein KKA69_02485 [Patescibacteria group bacterium]|nr:hypothetical protein [Patescibacteria group bacterium]